MRSLPGNLGQGKAAEYMVAANLLLRSIVPAFPAVDIGYDLITSSGVRVQVKSARISKTGSYKDGAYWFKLSTRAFWKEGKRRYKTRVFSEECDFVVLWGIDQNRFWVVPAALLDGHQLVVVGPDSRWVEADLEKIRKAREEKVSYRKIAEQENLSLGTVYRSANGRESSDKTNLTNTIRQHENRWDLIEAYEMTLAEAEVSASVKTLA